MGNALLNHKLFAADDIIPLPTGVNLPTVPEGVDLQALVNFAIQILLVFAVILAFIFFLLGGIAWISSGGNKEALEKAKKKITYSILGLIIALLSFVVIKFLAQIFGVEQGLFPK